MKFLCVDCDQQMTSIDTRDPGDGTLAVVFRCPACGRRTAMLTNPQETQMVSSLCVQVGGGQVRPEALDSVRSHLDAAEAGTDRPARDASRPSWSGAAEQRLARVPGFVRGMVRQMYSDWARDRGIAEVTEEVMDRARSDLGLEGM